MREDRFAEERVVVVGTGMLTLTELVCPCVDSWRIRLESDCQGADGGGCRTSCAHKRVNGLVDGRDVLDKEHLFLEEVAGVVARPSANVSGRVRWACCC